MKRQRIRRGMILVSLLLFPVTMNYFSPYIIVDGASQGIISGSFMLFSALFAGSLILGRAFCGWVCPAAGLQESLFPVNDKRTRRGKANLVKFVIWAPWILAIAGAAVSAGGFRKIDPLHLTESGISIDAPEKYYMYFTVLFVFVGLALVFGKRAGCHYICWMAPFMMAGTYLGKALKFPSLHLSADPHACTRCGSCTKKCPISLEVMAMVKRGQMYDSECALCLECVDSCPRKAISLRFGARR